MTTEETQATLEYLRACANTARLALLMLQGAIDGVTSALQALAETAEK